jgi:hypothetical protein
MTRIRSGQIDSRAAADGTVLTADGAGNAAWLAATGGSGGGQLLVADAHSTPLVFADILQNEAEDDLLYAD